MQEISNFIVNNWKFVITLVAIVVSFILQLIFKKRSKVFVSDDEYYSSITQFINEAELKFGAGRGKEKLQYVLHQFALKYGGWSFSVISTIEKILSTPQKKDK